MLSGAKYVIKVGMSHVTEKEEKMKFIRKMQTAAIYRNGGGGNKGTRAKGVDISVMQQGGGVDFFRVRGD